MDVVSACRLRASSLTWERKPGDCVLTVICKATFDLVEGQAQLSLEQDPVHEHASYWEGDPSRSLSSPSDLAPFKVRGDVVLVGHAYSATEPADALVARLAVGSFDKSIEVVADRTWSSAGGLQVRERFTMMPLSYERAVGGPHTWNPVGIVRDGRSETPFPNLQAPGTSVTGPNDYIDPIGFGPIASTWPTRRDKLGRNASTWSDDTWMSAPLPPDVDPSYWNFAPIDQQVTELRENARIVLENLHPKHARLKTRLPGVRPIAHVERPGKSSTLKLYCDTLWIDTDRGICCLVWRGAMPLASRTEAGTVTITMNEDQPRIAFEDPATTGDDEPVLSKSRPTLPFRAQGTVALPSQEMVSEVHARSRSTGGGGSSGATKIFNGPPPGGAPAWFKPLDGPAAVPPVSNAPPSIAPASLSPQSLGQPLAQLPSNPPPPLPSTPPPSMPPTSSSPHPTTAIPWVVGGPQGYPPVAEITRPDPNPAWSAADPRPANVPAWAPPQPPPEAVAVAVVSAAAVQGSPWSVPSAPARPALAHAPSAGAVAASDAAARSEHRPVEPAVAERPVRSLHEAVDLLWWNPASVKRIRAVFRERIADLDFRDTEPKHEIALDKPEDQRTRRAVFAVLAEERPEDTASLSRIVNEAVDQYGHFTAPLVVFLGEMKFQFDEVEQLKAMVGAVTPVMGSDKKLKESIDFVNELLKTPSLQGSGNVVSRIQERLQTELSQSNRALPTNYVDVQVERALLEQRKYQKRTVFGEPHLRLLFQGGGSHPTPAYLPEAVSQQLPMCTSLRVRVIAEVVPLQDQFESAPFALKMVAVGRVIRLDRSS